MSTKIQEYAQAAGPHIPTVRDIMFLLAQRIPFHADIEAISINGQTGVITVEVRLDDMPQTFKLKSP